jgi:hypothetical protein
VTIEAKFRLLFTSYLDNVLYLGLSLLSPGSSGGSIDQWLEGIPLRLGSTLNIQVGTTEEAKSSKVRNFLIDQRLKDKVACDVDHIRHVL